MPRQRLCVRTSASRRLAARLARAGLLLCVLLAGLGLAPAAPAAAQDQEEVRFIFIVPPGFEQEVIAFWTAYRDTLYQTYDFYRLLYAAEPPLPINIQVYSSRDELLRLNLLVPPLPAGALHTHLGAREISLIAPWPEGYLLSAGGLASVRFELNSVFLSTLGANNLPGGLELGLSQYVASTPGQRAELVERLAAAHDAGELYSLRALLDSPRVYSDERVGHAQAYAVTAYLVDRFGFPSLVRLARSLRQGESLDEALSAIYNQPLDRLEQDWLASLPDFLAGRWQYNALYEYDLAPFEAALEAGAYGQVSRGLAAAIPFLELSGQTETAERARQLLERAAAGGAAGNLVVQTRAALEAGLYERTLTLVDEARAAYAELGDTSREAELAAYAARAQRVLDLRARLEAAAARLQAGESAAAEAELLTLVPQLQTVGDGEHVALAEGLLALIDQERQAAAAQRQLLARRGLLLFAGLLGVVLLHQTGRLIYRRWRPPEPAIL